jgi:hypothetical protein
MIGTGRRATRAAIPAAAEAPARRNRSGKRLSRASFPGTERASTVGRTASRGTGGAAGARWTDPGCLVRVGRAARRRLGVTAADAGAVRLATGGTTCRGSVEGRTTATVVDARDRDGRTTVGSTVGRFGEEARGRACLRGRTGTVAGERAGTVRGCANGRATSASAGGAALSSAAGAGEDSLESGAVGTGVTSGGAGAVTGERAGSRPSGSRYPSGSAVSRTPRWRCDDRVTASALSPTVPTTADSGTMLPRATVVVASWRSVTLYPSAVSIVTTRPPAGTEPTKETIPAAGAATAVPTGTPRSMPRCCPAAYSSPESEKGRRMGPSTGHDQPDAAGTASRDAIAVTIATVSLRRMGHRLR